MFRFAGAFVGTLLLLAPGLGHAQVRLETVDGGPADVGPRSSSFLLFGEGDRASTGMRPTGTMSFIVTNTGLVDSRGIDWDVQPTLFGCSGCPAFQGFDFSPIYAAGRNEWVRFLSQVPELINAKGNGYAVSYNQPTLGGHRDILASDFQFGVLFSGVASTLDGGCQDHSQQEPAGAEMGEGVSLLAANNCPPTWPEVGGVPTWGGPDVNPDKLLSFSGGLNPISESVYLDAKNTLFPTPKGETFNFEWWRVDGDHADIDPSKFFGNIQTYGAYDDFNSSKIGRFGNVVPGGTGAPTDEGWPLGLRTEFTSFTLALPTVANAQYWRAIIINETAKVYGIPEGLDYENLYIGYTDNRAHGSQESAYYHQVWRGAIVAVESNTSQNPNCGGVAPPGNSGIDCVGDAGFNNGTSAIVVLKSPIGDLRNVLLTCNPGDAAQRAAEDAIPCTTPVFNDPSNPHAGDTITYNHHMMCPFGTCHSNTVVASRKQHFGGLSSDFDLVLDGRDPSVIGDGLYQISRTPNWPQERGPMNIWVPGTWDYSANGDNVGGDTLFVPTCYGPPGLVIEGTTRENRTDACVTTFADTMPVGALGNLTYNNQEGNISYWSVGPFALAAGDTTSLVLVKMHQVDSLSFETELDNVIDLYMNFYLSPEAPPKVTIVGVDVVVEDPALGGGRGEITLFWDDANDDYVDPFLDAFADALEAAPAGDLARIRTLNPFLVADIRFRARDNLEEIVIFKSCDGGQTFTMNDQSGGVLDCDADRARGTDGATLDAGWQAYAVLPVDSDGDAPNSFVDDNNFAGATFLYNVSGRSRGGNFAIVDSVDTTGDGFFDSVAPDSLLLAPSLLNPLATASTEPNVVSVYLPATVQSGSQLASASIVEAETFFLATVPAEFQFTTQSPLEARFRIVFANEFEVTELTDAEGLILSTTVVARDLVDADPGPVTTAVDSVVVTSDNPNGVQVASESLLSITVGLGPPDTTVSIFTGLGLFLYRLDTGVVGDEPLFVSTEIDGGQTTPPTFFDRVATGDFTGFPGFVFELDNSDGGEIDRTFYQVTADSAAPEIPTQVVPTVTWDAQNSEAIQVGGISAFGRYEFLWDTPTFGVSSFTINTGDPGVTQTAYTDALNARAVAQTGVTDSAAAALISPFLSAPITADSLVAAKLPFAAINASFGRSVEVAMLKRPGGATANDVLLGNVGTGDTITVKAPSDVWIPGDELFFLETVTLDSIGVGGGVVLDGSGQVIKVQTRVVTFAPALLSCLTLPRASCNPVIGDGTTNDWVSNAPGQNQVADYFVPVDREFAITFDTRAAITGEDAILAGMDIRPQMDSIKVVPNPYIMFSKWQVASGTNDDARLLFSHLPPTGSIRIFTVSGQFVQELSWTPDILANNGDLFWNLRTREGTDVAGGLYIFVVEAVNPLDGSDVKKTGKFVIVR